MGTLTEESRRIACVECRQQKVKCTGSDEPGSPCDRCSRRNLNCVIDVDYKRTAKRKRMAMMEQEMELLRRQISANGATPAAGATTSDGSNVNSPATESEPSVSHASTPVQTAVPRRPTSTVDDKRDALPKAHYTNRPRMSTTPPNALGLVKDWYSDPQTVDDVSLDSATIEQLFREYVLHYHPIIPVVDVSLGPAQIHARSPALFWSIMAVASRRYLEGTLTESLSSIQKACIAEIAVSPVVRYGTGKVDSAFNLPSVYAVQAFIISSLWPLPTSSFNADSSWNTSGMAVFTATRAGLHVPGHNKEFSRVKAESPLVLPKINEQCTTWLAANNVSQMVAGMFGYPSVASFKPLMLKNMDIPEKVRHSFEIQMAEHEIEVSLNSSARDIVGVAPVSERLSLIRILSGRLDHLEGEFGPYMDDHSWFELLAARVHLYSYYFFDTNDLSTAQVQKGFVAAYNACMALMDHVHQVSSRDENFIKYMPLVQIHLLWQAGTIVNKLYHSRWATNLAKRKGKDLYLKTVENLSKASVFDHDISFRGAEILQQMWQVFSSMASAHEKVKNASVSINTRMAASVFFDSLWTMRGECEILSHAPTVLRARSRQASRKDMAGPSETTTGLPPRVQPMLPIHQVANNMMAMRALPTSNVRGIEPNQPALAGPSSSTDGIVVASPGGTRMPGLETPPQDQSPDSQQPTPDQFHFEWDANAAWKDVNIMMEDFGFQIDDPSLLENLV